MCHIPNVLQKNCSFLDYLRFYFSVFQNVSTFTLFNKVWKINEIIPQTMILLIYKLNEPS